MTFNTKQELKDFVSKALDQDDELQKLFFHSEVTDDTSKWDEDCVTEFREICSENGVSFKFKDNYGGEEQGRQFWSVYSFTSGDHTVYVKFDGWYASYHGSEYEEYKFVEPVEKVIMVFE